MKLLNTTAVLTAAGLAIALLSGCQPDPPSPGPSKSPETTPSPTSTPEPSPAPSESASATAVPTRQPSPSKSTGPVAPGGVPAPGSVGFRGNASALRVVDSSSTPPAGTRWQDGALRMDGGEVVLDGVYVKGGIDMYQGKLVIRNSIVEGDRRSWAPIMARAGTLDVRDTTIRFKAGEPPRERWSNGAIHGDAKMTVLRCDISGTPDGIQIGGGESLIEQNHIHDLALLGVYPNNTHNDGIQNYGGRNLIIRYNRIDIRDPQGRAYDGTHQNGAIFVQPSESWKSEGLQVVGNFLAGGGFTLRLEGPMTGAVVTGNRFGPTTGGWGEVMKSGSVQIASWADNLNASGQAIRQP